MIVDKKAFFILVGRFSVTEADFANHLQVLDHEKQNNVQAFLFRCSALLPMLFVLVFDHDMTINRRQNLHKKL